MSIEPLNILTDAQKGGLASGSQPLFFTLVLTGFARVKFGMEAKIGTGYAILC